jgi:hypothetical protein
MIAGWATATVLAVLLGLQGVGVVSDSVSGTRQAPLSPSRVRAALSSNSSSSAASASPSTDATSASSGDVPPPAESDSSPVTASPDTVAVPPPVTGSVDDHGDDSSGSQQSTSSSGSVAPIDETYQLIGGTVSVRYENATARVLWATPAPGFEVENEGGDDATVDIRFSNDDHESRLRAFWNNGPQHTIEEKND